MSDSKQPSLQHQVSRAVLWNTLFVPLRMLAEVAATALKLTVLPIAAYGLLALISGASSAFGTWIDLGTTRALPKFIPETMRSHGPAGVLRMLLSVFWAQSILLVTIAAGLIWQQSAYLDSLAVKINADTRIEAVSQTVLHELLGSHGWLFITIIILMLITGVAYDMLMAFLNSFFKQRAWNGISLLAGLLPQLLAVVAIGLAQLSRDPLSWSVIGILVTSGLAPALAVTVAAWQVIAVWRSAPEAAPHLEAKAFRWLPDGFLRYTGVSYLMTMTDFVASKSFAVYLTSSITDAALLWAGASLVGMVLSYLYTPLVGITVPLFTRVRSGEGGTIQGAFGSIVRIQMLLLIPGGVALVLLAQAALLILTPQYADAVAIVYVLVPCLFIESLLTMAHNVLIVYEELRLVTIGRLLTLVVIPLGFFLAPTYGVVGLAFAYGFARIVAGVWATFWGWRRIGLVWPWTFMARVSLASGAMALSLYGCHALLPTIAHGLSIGSRLALLPWYGLVTVANALVFLLVFRLCGGLEKEDRDQLAKLKIPFKSTILRVV
ncbi:MAG: hypothetical protein RLY87_2476 [Chloroflexota bacterium]|jgi:O-antigen/teichoic acid export membrane protein